MLLRISFTRAFLFLCCVVESLCYVTGGTPKHWLRDVERDPALGDLVTWDEHSLFVRGERIVFYSGEFHPFRLPVPSLWLDVFQKLKAAGFNAVSFYSDWALLEGKPGDFSAKGVFAWEPFFDAATKAGIYLLARPGPYINAEVSGGGFPGWLTRVNGRLRTRDPEYLKASENYTANMGKLIAKAQITNGGPVIMLQVENEYVLATPDVQPFPDPVYYQYVKDQFKKQGVVVPVINNDAWPAGIFTPGKEAAADIYGHDGYPLGFDCANPTVWKDDALPGDWGNTHKKQSPSTPYAIVEFQGGAFDPWGGNGFDKCSALLNHEFARVFYKQNYAFGATIFNIYMAYGGTNWGNLGHHGGYTSYDYGALIAEDRTIAREKYSEVKLEASFLQVSPAWLVADRGNASTSWTDNQAITVTPALTNSTKFYFTRQTRFNSLEPINYKLNIQSKLLGNLSVPQLKGTLTLTRRDTKVHVSDYLVGDFNLLYSSAEIFTWQKYADKTVLVVYGGPSEQHELAVETKDGAASLVEGDGVTISKKKDHVILNWATTSDRRVVHVSEKLYVYILDRNSAYNYWVVDLPTGSYSAQKKSSLVVKAGYLVRTAKIDGNSLSLTGDVNATTPIEVLGGIPNPLGRLTFNGAPLRFTQKRTGEITSSVKYELPKLNIPKLSSLRWKYLDSLPEIGRKYSDERWRLADINPTPNILRPLTTPTSLYGADYGYNGGSLIFRGTFKATGNERNFSMRTQGGSGFGMTTWLDDRYLGAWKGNDISIDNNSTFTLPTLRRGNSYTFTVLIDHMGFDGTWWVGSDTTKIPRGILNYAIGSSDNSSSPITWKLTGNFGGENYADRIRGPLNEGAMYAERQGYHLPNPPSASWKSTPGPVAAGIPAAGVGFFATSFDLDLPRGYDIPLAFQFTNSTSTGAGSAAPAYRAQLFVNGYQFGKYVNNIGPQTVFPVPEGILNYHGKNWVSLTLWSLEEKGAKLGGLELIVSGTPVQSGFGKVELSPVDEWKERRGAY